MSGLHIILYLHSGLDFYIPYLHNMVQEKPINRSSVAPFLLPLLFSKTVCLVPDSLPCKHILARMVQLPASSIICGPALTNSPENLYMFIPT